MTKNNFRKELKTHLNIISPAQRFKKSQEAWDVVLNSSFWREAEAVLAYSPMPDELDSGFLLQEALRQGKALFLPRIMGKAMAFLAVFDLDELEGSCRGPEEPPASAAEANYALLSKPLMIAPGLAANERGYRLGRGSGYYDRYMADNQSEALTSIVAVFSENIISFDEENFDQPFNYILTEKGLTQSKKTGEL